MKKLSLIALTALAAASAQAAPVSPADAIAYAKAYIARVIQIDRTPTEAQIVNIDGTDALYSVSLAPEGWMLIAADDVIAPIVGYSEVGSLHPDSIDPNFRAYLGHFATDVQIRSQRGSSAHPAWATDTIPPVNKALKSSVDPLIKINWNQSGKYNQSCPTNATLGRALVGCVAVGLAQAMSVYRQPARPVGFKSYKSDNYGTLTIDYDAESAYDWNLIMSGDDGYVECARFLYHCGVAVEMDYGPSGSGVSMWSMGIVPQALRTIFGYSNRATNVKKASYTEDEWIDLLKGELSEGRPIIYAGSSSSGGHCFNIDGYNASGLFHFNFGWGGSGNGYITISGHEYNSGEIATLNCAPASGKPLDISLSKSSVAKGTAAGVTVATISTETDKDGCEFSYSIAGVANPVTGIVSTPPFSISGDNLVTNSTFASKYGASSAARTVSFVITSTNVVTGDALDKQMSVSLSAAGSDALPQVLADVRYVVSRGSVSVTSGSAPLAATLTSLDGKPVATASLAPFSSASLAPLTPGVYVLSLSASGTTTAEKFLVK